MQIQLNGEAHTVADTSTVADLVSELGLDGRRLAVEINGEIITRSAFQAHRLDEGDRMEIVHAIGGG